MSEANSITNILLLEIPKAYPTRARVWRANVLGAKTAQGRFVRAGRKGQADVSGIIQINGLGVRLEVEIKAGRDRLSEAQVLFGAMVQRMGGIYLVARSVEECMRELEYVVGVKEGRIAKRD